MRKSLAAIACVAVVALFLSACSSSKKSSSTATTAAAAATTAAPTTAAPTTAAPTTAAPDTTTTAPAQTITITPDTGLADGQMVHIVGKGYVAGKTYGITECADKGNATGAGDCNLRGIKVANADATGTVTTDYPVAKGPFGSNAIVCSAAQKCLVSVANAGSANPTEVASLDITFGP